MRKKLLLPAIAITLSTSAQTERNMTLNPVIITGTGTYHKAEDSPVAVKVISQKELKDTNAKNLQETLTKLTTNITTHTNGMGTAVNFNGVSDDYILILENGKKVTGDDRWNRISIDNIKRIEILPGAASALYGSEAIAGVINIITDDLYNGVQVSASTKMMSKGRYDHDINIDAKQGKFSTLTSFSHHQADNWQVNKYQAFMEGDKEVYKLTGRPMSMAFISNNVSEKIGWTLNEKWDFYAKGDYNDYHTARNRNATYFTQKITTDKTTGEKSYSYTPKTAYSYDLQHNSYNIGAGTRWVPNKDTHIYLDIYTDNFSSAYDHWQTNEEEAYKETRKCTHYFNETLKGIFRLDNHNKVSAGLEMIQESLNSISDNINKESTFTYNAFGQDEVTITKNLQTVIGLRFTNNNNFGSHITPNIALFYHINGISLRASYAGGYRTPSLSQLFATDQAKTTARYTINNINLKPEKNHFWNLNAEYSNTWANINVTTFINDISDMINYRTIPMNEIETDDHLMSLYNEGWTTIRQRDNIDKAKVKGFSVNVKLLLPYGFMINGGYSYNDAKATTKTLNDKTQEYDETVTPVDKSIRNIANVNLSWYHQWHNYCMNVCINSHIQGERYSSTYGFAPAYQQWNICSRHTISLPHITLEPSIGIDNVFNKKDTSYWNANFSTVSPGRSLEIGLTVRLEGNHTRTKRI